MQDSDNEIDLYSERRLFHTSGASGAEVKCERRSYFPFRSSVLSFQGTQKFQASRILEKKMEIANSPIFKQLDLIDLFVVSPIQDAIMDRAANALRCARTRRIGITPESFLNLSLQKRSVGGNPWRSKLFSLQRHIARPAHPSPQLLKSNNYFRGLTMGHMRYGPQALRSEGPRALPITY